MVDNGDKEDSFEFTDEGEAVEYIGLDEARVLAMRTAAETPGAYGRRFEGVPMAFELVSQIETEDHYTITLSLRPQGAYSGTPGREEFFITKVGEIRHRQVLAVPVPTGTGRCWRSPCRPEPAGEVGKDPFRLLLPSLPSQCWSSPCLRPWVNSRPRPAR
ncbi:MAG: hypothetical protein FI707_01200 [SAR202 cluster bacterium]|jgi:hypothetical protein|nr:hypothetical protein [SAR202 cluster bacterium]MQG67395.1 hypothetical protein [SAR202 cluster bacterium]|tara:strand:+ start:380 stop:859 length:480 start_codon:yes stop_codon:yes gene_type:complete